MKHSKYIIAIVMVVLTLLAASTPPARADDGHRHPPPFPPPIPDVTHYCESHACTLVCTVRGDDDDEHAQSAGHLRWRYIHGEEDSRHIRDWMKHHPHDFYYGQDVFSWICTDHAVFVMRVAR